MAAAMTAGNGCHHPPDGRAPGGPETEVTRTRPGTLRAIHRALAPGGILLEQELDSKPADTAHAPALALRRMVFHGWGISFASTAEQLAVEAQAAGFTLIRIATTNLGRMVVLRR
ncbi:hypothetical protein [Micromonospora sp. WMMD964]|uniref:hypothetical protein n=1 Tax=Micromonospora sp. WMMD964 TaxID=3016091 RepID=UPI00249C04F3|nr:hypothetical protein [Micromonospora sp. WMMD964]WFF00226.1 hypothetical protein O7616_25535 [Micromonospora sp. WMMD964]